MLSPDLYKNKMVSIECFEKFNHEEEKNPSIDNSMETYILVKSTLVYVICQLTCTCTFTCTLGV